MTLGDIIKTYRHESNITMEEFAQLSNLSKGYISMLERNVNPKTKRPIVPSFDTIKQIATAINMDVNTLISILDDQQPISLNDKDSGENSRSIPGARPVTVKTIPLFTEISCGQPVFADDTIKCYVPVGDDIEADFCVIANGDSMTGARINDGDVVFIQEVPQIKNGEIAAVWIDGDGATLKRVYIQGSTLTLISENPKYPPLIYTEERAQEVRLLGKAVAFQSTIV